MSHRFTNQIAILIVACLALCAGCGQQPRRFAKPKPPDFRRFGELPALAKSADPQLVDELARLRAEEATPAQLAAREPAVDVQTQMNLRDDVPVQRVRSLLEDIDEVYPRGRFELSSATQQRARDLLAHEAKLIEKAQQPWQGDAPQTIVDHAQGLLADHYLLELAELAHRAGALQAQVAMTDGQFAEAASSVYWMLTLDHRLATMPSLLPRVKGAQLRLEALRVLEMLVRDEAVTAATLASFRDLLQTQLANWPEDADAWIGDRAQGLHTYEMIRHGLVLSIFTDDELKDLGSGAGASATAKAIAKDVDTDQRYYLKAMREMIAACEQPYYQRRAVLQQIRDDLQRNRNAPDFPIVAGRILLTDLDGGHRWQAKDRAACEGWAIALCVATGASPPAYTLNPETGVAYAVQHEVTRVVLQHSRAGEPDEAVIVPAFDNTNGNAAQAVSPTTSRAR